MNAITMKDMRCFDKDVAKIVLDAVNKHGVRHRMLDGRHVRLFCADREVVPIKIAAVRPGKDTMRHLLPWLEKNIPTWKEAQ